MGRMHMKLKNSLLKPPQFYSRSGPIVYDEKEVALKEKPHFSHSQGFELGKLGKKKNEEQDAEAGHLGTSKKNKKQKKGLFWNWSNKGPLSFFQQGSFDCIFSIHIHSIQNLPDFYRDGLLLEVHCIRKGRSAKTLPSRAIHGTADFEETLHLRSRVRASKHPPHSIKQPVSKSFRLLVISCSASDQGLLGEITLDLGRILPNAIADTADYASQSAWTSAFKITSSEKLKGASIVASIGYEFPEPNGTTTGIITGRSESCRFTSEQSSSTFWRRRLRPLSGLLTSSSSLFARSESMRSMPDLSGLAHEACSSCSENEDEGEEQDVEGIEDQRLNSLLCSLVKAQVEGSQKGADHKPALQEPVELTREELRIDEQATYNSSDEDAEFLVEKWGLLEVVRHSRDGKEVLPQRGTFDAGFMHTSKHADEPSSCSLEKQVSYVDYSRSSLNPDELEKQAIEEDHLLSKNDHTAADSGCVLDIFEADSVAQQFLKMLKDDNGNDGDFLEPLGSPVYEANWILAPIPEEEEEIPCDYSIPIAAPVPQLQSIYTATVEPAVDSANFQAFVPSWKKEDDLELVCIMEAAESELQKATQVRRSRSRAKVIEDVETEALLRQWGLDDKAFEENGSPMKPSAHGRPFVRQDCSLSLLPPNLSKEMGPVLRMKGGGELRTMSPANFQSDSGGCCQAKLVMQLSKPVVLNPAKVGCSGVGSAVDVLRETAAGYSMSAAMPLEDITGKSLQEIASERNNAGNARGLQDNNGFSEPASRAAHLMLEWGPMDTRPPPLAARDVNIPNAVYGRSGHLQRQEPQVSQFASVEELAPLAMQRIEALAIEGLRIQAGMAREDAPYSVSTLACDEAIDYKAVEQHEYNEDELPAMAISLDEWIRLDAGVCNEAYKKGLDIVLAGHHGAHKEEDSGMQTRLTSGLMGNTLTLALSVQLRDPLRDYEPVGAPMMAMIHAERVQAAQAVLQFKITSVDLLGASETESAEKSSCQQQSSSRWLIANGMGKSKPEKLLRSGSSSSRCLWSISSHKCSKGSFHHTRNPDVVCGSSKSTRTR